MHARTHNHYDSHPVFLYKKFYIGYDYLLLFEQAEHLLIDWTSRDLNEIIQYILLFLNYFFIKKIFSFILNSSDLTII